MKGQIMKLFNLYYHNLGVSDLVTVYGKNPLPLGIDQTRAEKMLLCIAAYNNFRTLSELETFTIPDITMQEVLEDCAIVLGREAITHNDNDRIETIMDVLGCNEEKAREVLKTE